MNQALAANDNTMVDKAPDRTVLVSYLQDIVEMLLRCGADVNVRHKTGDTPLLIAARNEDSDAFALLCAHGGMHSHIPRTASEEKQGDLIHRAISGGSVTIVETVLQHSGAVLNTCFEHGWTPLSLAASGHIRREIVELLLSRGADPNAEVMPPQWVMQQGSSRAVHAAVGGNVKIVQMLLQYGADANARTGCGDTPLSLAMKGKRQGPGVYVKDFDGVVNMLLSSGAVMDERLSLLVQELESPSAGRTDFAVPGA